MDVSNLITLKEYRYIHFIFTFLSNLCNRLVYYLDTWYSEILDITTWYNLLNLTAIKIYMLSVNSIALFCNCSTTIFISLSSFHYKLNFALLMKFKFCATEIKKDCNGWYSAMFNKDDFYSFLLLKRVHQENFQSRLYFIKNISNFSWAYFLNVT